MGALKKISSSIMCLLSLSCQKKSDKNNYDLSTLNCDKINIHINYLHKNDAVNIFYNKILLYTRLYDDEHNSFNSNINDKVCITYTNTGVIRLKISGRESYPIDTTIIIHKSKFQYYILIGYPVDRYLKDIYRFPRDGYNYKQFPRAVAVKLDTIFKNTVSD